MSAYFFESRPVPAAASMRDLLHAWRDSLCVIMCHAYLLRDGGRPGGHAAGLQIIHEQARRLAELLKLVPESVADAALETGGAALSAAADWRRR